MAENMTITIGAQQAETLTSAAERLGLPPQELVEDAIERVYGQRSEVEAGRDAPDESAENFRELMRELASMPVEHPQDTLGGRDHDRILYGERP